MTQVVATPVKQIAAGVLDVGYADVGPADGPAVVLLHGWPYDIHTFDEVSPLLAAAGNRVIVPYLRGYGTTRAFSPTRRSATGSSRSWRSTSSRSRSSCSVRYAYGEEKATKTKANRTVRLLDALRRNLAEWRLASGRPPESARVFPASDG